MNESLIFEILLRIVKQMPYTEGLRQLKTFAVVQKLDFISEVLESVQEDLGKGLFWSRDWVANGANENKRKREYPMLLVRRLSIIPNQDRTATNKYCQRFAVAIADIDNADECIDCKRNIEEIKTDVFKILHIVKKELLKYAKYSVVINSTTQDTWATQSEIDYMLTEGIISNATPKNNYLYNYIKSISDFQFFDIGIDNGHAIQFFFDLCGCETTDVSMNYSYKDSDVLPIIECKTC